MPACPLTTMAVNISALEFRDENFLDGCFAILDETGLDPTSLELELTESVLMKHAESTASILRTLRAKGVQVAVDDFGTGYSSLSYLRKFPIDALKIDQSFVREITTAPRRYDHRDAVISMGRSLKLRVVAEGVETREELAFLQAHQCDEAQGYYFSRPVPPWNLRTCSRPVPRSVRRPRQALQSRPSGDELGPAAQNESPISEPRGGRFIRRASEQFLGDAGPDSPSAGCGAAIFGPGKLGR